MGSRSTIRIPHEERDVFRHDGGGVGIGADCPWRHSGSVGGRSLRRRRRRCVSCPSGLEHGGPELGPVEGPGQVADSKQITQPPVRGFGKKGRWSVHRLRRLFLFVL